LESESQMILCTGVAIELPTVDGGSTPFGSHQFPMPAQDRIRSHDSGNLLQHVPAEDLALTARQRRWLSLSKMRFLPSFSLRTWSQYAGTRSRSAAGD
jgi:hypothetical protein